MGELVRLTEEAAPPYSQLILWPEVPGELNCLCQDFIQRNVHGAVSNAPVMATCIELDFGNHKIVELLAGNNDQVRITTQKIEAMYNAVWLVLPDNDCTPVYRKTRLMPFGEKMPLRSIFPGLVRAIGPETDYTAGTGAKVVTLKPGGLGIQPLICLEIGYSDMARQGIAEGARAFVLTANELWFSSIGAARFQLAHSIFRAVEFRRPVVRCTNSGLGAHIGPTGRILDGTLTPFMEKAAVAASVHCPGVITLYAAMGNSWLWLPVVIIMTGLARRRHLLG